MTASEAKTAAFALRRKIDDEKDKAHYFTTCEEIHAHNERRALMLAELDQLYNAAQGIVIPFAG